MHMYFWTYFYFCIYFKYMGITTFSWQNFHVQNQLDSGYNKTSAMRARE